MKQHALRIGVLGIIIIVIVLLSSDSLLQNNSNLALVSDAAQLQSKNEQVMVPDFTAHTLSGDTITLSDYQGDKPVILDFWASWCHNCQRALPKTNALYEKYKDQIEVIAVNLGESEEVIQEYVASENLTFPIILDPAQNIAQAYGVTYTSSHFFVNTKGELVHFVSGDIDEDDFLKLINP